MKALIVAANISRRMGGEAVIPFHYIRELRAQGVDVHALTHARVRDELRQADLLDPDKIVFVEDSGSEIALHRVGERLPAAIREVTFRAAVQVRTMQRLAAHVDDIVRRENIDVIHQPTPVSPRFPSPVKSRLAPVIIGPMNGGMDYPPAFEATYSNGSRTILAVGRTVSEVANGVLDGKRRAARVLAANTRTRDSLPRVVDPARVEILVENGVDLPFWPAATTPPPTVPHFVFAGRLVWWKAVELLIDAFARIRSDARLTIIGDGEARADLQRRAAASGAGDRITFAGFRPQAEIATMLRSATALVLPSLRECGGAVVLEAFACGRPAIATAWGGPTDYITEATGILVPPTGRDEFTAGLAAAMERLAANPALVTEMGTAARARVEGQFSWAAKATRMIEIYADVIRAARAAAT